MECVDLSEEFENSAWKFLYGSLVMKWCGCWLTYIRYKHFRWWVLSYHIYMFLIKNVDLLPLSLWCPITKERPQQNPPVVAIAFSREAEIRSWKANKGWGREGGNRRSMEPTTSMMSTPKCSVTPEQTNRIFKFYFKKLIMVEVKFDRIIV